LNKMDYKKLGFKCGIEIHQQLNTHKLFCNCPSEIRRDEPDFIIKRQLRASAGEGGKVDVAAKYEQKKQKYFLYQGYSDTTCLVEADDEPPHDLNHQALIITLQVAKALNAKIVDKIQFMRKVVVDGSNTSGFQRTALVARDGYITIDNKKITIPVICLEEEACQAIEKNKDYSVYNLSRLGIPLIEITTGPDITSPEMCKKTAEYLGMILRSTAKVKRGIGTIRQDVNISIRNGNRTEIKGFQNLKSIPKVIDYEITRQSTLIKNHKKIKKEVRKAEYDFKTTYLRPMPGSARMYPETDIKPIEVTKKLLQEIPKTDLIKDKISKLIKKHKLRKDLVIELIKQAIDITDFIKKYPKLEPNFIAKTLIEDPKEIKKRYSLDIDILNTIHPVFEKLNNNGITKEAVFEILIELAKGKTPNYTKYKPSSKKDIEQDIKITLSNNPGAPINALMGIIMSKYRGKIDGKTVIELIKKHTKK